MLGSTNEGCREDEKGVTKNVQNELLTGTLKNTFGEAVACVHLFPSLLTLVEGCSESHYLHIILGYAKRTKERLLCERKVSG